MPTPRRLPKRIRNLCTATKACSGRCEWAARHASTVYCMPSYSVVPVGLFLRICIPLTRPSPGTTPFHRSEGVFRPVREDSAACGWGMKKGAPFLFVINSTSLCYESFMLQCRAFPGHRGFHFITQHNSSDCTRMRGTAPGPGLSSRLETGETSTAVPWQTDY